MEKEKETLGRKINQKEEELKDKIKEIEDVKILIQKKEKEYFTFK